MKMEGVCKAETLWAHNEEVGSSARAIRGAIDIDIPYVGPSTPTRGFEPEGLGSVGKEALATKLERA